MIDLKKALAILLCLPVIACLLSCSPRLRKEIHPAEEGLKPTRLSIPFKDDMDRESLILALRRNRDYLKRLAPGTTFQYGPHGVTLQEVLESHEMLLSLLAERPDGEELSRLIRKKYRFYRAAGLEGDGRVLFTGYYEPVYEGSLTPDETFRYPLYRPPDDLVKIDLSPFGERFKGESIVGRIEGRRVLPYYSRFQIEMEHALKGRGLEIAWLKDPVDVAFLHIQGSGRLRLPNGNDLPVHYRASNGRPYRSIGKYMIEKGYLSSEAMSMQAIRKYLDENPEDLDAVMNHNPSYVFFMPGENGPFGSLGVPLTPGRSVALDHRVFPKGALGFISCQKPVLNEQGEVLGWTPFSRFVLNQDSGGAIKGAGRADIFWGSGPYAESAAGHLQHHGELFLLLKKP